MVARDKAITMVAKYEKLGISFEVAKQCALLECDAIIDAFQDMSYIFPETIIYYHSVKQHIENL